MKKTVFFLICFFGLATVQVIHAAVFQQKKGDSILEEARSKYVYDNPDKAIRIGEEVFSGATNKRVKINALVVISTAYSSERDYKNALDHLLKAENLSESIDNLYLKIVVSTKLGELYYQLKVYDKAIRFLDKAEKSCLSATGDDPRIQFQLASNYIIKGFIYKDRLNCDIAISFFDKGIKEYNKAQIPSKNNNISIAEYNKGNCYILLLNYEAAIKSYQKAIKIAKSVSANSLQAFAKKGLAEVYTLQGHYRKALNLLENALKISENVGDLVLNREIYKGLSENYLALNDRVNYKKYKALYLDYRLQVKTSERKSINTSINRIIQQNNVEFREAKNRFDLFFKILILAGIVIIIVTIILIKKQKKSILALRRSIKTLQKPEN